MTGNKKKLLSISSIIILIGIGFVLVSFGPLIKDELFYLIRKITNNKYLLSDNQVSTDPSVFGSLILGQDIFINPINRDFSIVIEKIGVNAPVIENVSVVNEKEYTEALKIGVAHAVSSAVPSESAGNTYLFAHASLNFFKLGEYATVFNLLRKLEVGDTVHVFYHQRDFEYLVVSKEIVRGWDVRPLTKSVIEPILTLQTCDPPGTTLNRLIIVAKLKGVND